MLIYHPAFDINHACYRILQLLYHMKDEEVEIERIQIWDFYYVFPSQVQQNFQFTSETLKLKKLFKATPNPYEDINNPHKIFLRMREFQKIAINNLISYGVVDAKNLDEGKISIVRDNLPKELSDSIKKVSLQQENLIKLISSPFNDLPLYGQSGFKRRTGIMEFKYDRD